MKKLIAVSFLLLLCMSIRAQEKVYFAKPIDSRGFIIEDHISSKNNIDFWGKPEYGMDYDKYTSYVRDIVKKYSSYNDSVREYYIEGWKDEFSHFTDIKPGARFYISSGDNVWEAEVNGYYINLDDEIYGGVMFYPIVDYKGRVKLPDYELVVCSHNKKISRIHNKGTADKNIGNTIKSKLLPLVKGLTYSDWEGDKEKKHKVKSIADDEIKIFKLNSAGEDDEYLVSYTKRLNFDNYASAVFIMDEDGNITAKPSDLTSGFTYTKSIGIVDTDGDGMYEIIIESGYYEGAGYELWKYIKDGFISIANGFNWGV
jgi:hypothetical protein